MLVTINRNFEPFQHLKRLETLETDFLENEKLFEKTGALFL